jgi:tetratricopeptide (TPR) repeat protein/tRNA A-37 threonylcarbamoyl transferase component Bud32
VRSGGEIPEQLRTALAGRYAIEAEINQGGMATVYRARDLRHPRHVAVKVLAPHLATTVGAERFLGEIRTAAQLLHPHILGLIDSGDAAGMLYYIMPYVRGESLRERIDREHQIPLADTARIIREVASALEYAHGYPDPAGRGIVHRDVKPENILLADGTHVLVADFGLARAIVSAARPKITVSGMIVGTPPYMSPEQSLAGPVDGRSDIYSLGCVLFEMLTGSPPFEADDVDRLLGLHRAAAPPRLRTRRPDLPAAVEDIVQRALQKDPAARYQHASDVSRALDAAIAGYGTAVLRRVQDWLIHMRRRGGRAWGLTASAAALLVITAFSVDTPVRRRVVAWWTTGPDTTRYVIVPFRRGQGTPPGPNLEVMFRDAIARWDSVKVVDQFQVIDAVAQHDTLHFSAGDAQRVAKQLAAGRYVWGDVTGIGDSLRIHAALFDVDQPRTALTEQTITIGAANLAIESQLRRVADALLFRGAPPRSREALDVGTSSYAAGQAYLRAQRALQDWNLADADTALSTAVTVDPNFAAANLWLGYVRGWTDDTTHARSIAGRAVAGRDRLPARERKLADALLHLADRQFPEACALYRELKSADPRDFAATYGLGECVRRDDIVVRDARSRSGWRFRSSYRQAVVAYREAFELLPSIHKAFLARAFEQVRRIMMTSANSRRLGRPLPPDTTSFRAAPSWEGDTLAFVPFAIQFERLAPARTIPVTTVEAVNHQRAMFREIAASWRKTFPDAVEPLEAMAVALELLGDSTALDTLAVARAKPASADQRLRLAVQEVWLRIKLGVPDDTTGIAKARELADSLLGHGPGGGTSTELLAGLAVLTGRGHRAAALARQSAKPLGLTVPSRTTSASRALLVYSALGGPVDSLRALDRTIAAGVETAVAEGQQADAISQLAEQAAGLSFPAYRFTTASRLAGRRRPVIDAQLAAARGDSAQARKILSDLRKRRATLRPSDLTLDVTYSGAQTLFAIGDRDAAIAWLDPVLNAAQLYPPQSLSGVANAGAFVRALALRAQLAHEAGDQAGARRWAQPVVILWKNADAFLQPVAERMRTLSTQ